MEPTPSANSPQPDDISDAALVMRLKELPVLAGLSGDELKRMVRDKHIREEQYSAGEMILRHGAYNMDAYYVLRGVVEVLMPTVSTSKAAVLPGPSRPASEGLVSRLSGMLGMPRPDGATNPAAPPREPRHSSVSDDGTVVLPDAAFDMNGSQRIVLEKGEIFGESNALFRYPSSTDVIAVTETMCLLISSFALRTVMKKNRPEFIEAIHERYRTRGLRPHLRKISLFEPLSDNVIDHIVKRAKFESFEIDEKLAKGDDAARRQYMAGVRIVKQDSVGDKLYLVVTGHVKVSVTVREGAPELALTYLRKGDYAGELCLLMDEPWPFSLFALEHVELITIARAEVEEIIASSNEAQKELWATGIRRLKQRGFALKNPAASRQLQMAMDTGLIHGTSVLLIDLNTCTRCDDCVRACAETHDGTARFIREGVRQEQWSVVAACYQCEDPVCLVGCPTGAIRRTLDGKLEVTINDSTCIGCEVCAKNCPWKNIVMVPNRAPSEMVKAKNTGKEVLDRASPTDDEWDLFEKGKFIKLANKCDNCVGRPGSQPACVQACPHGSAKRISFREPETVAAKLGLS